MSDKQAGNRGDLHNNHERTEENRPVGKRFVKGQSGNPKGRPPKHECLTSLLKEELEKVNAADKEGRTWMELVVVATLRLAIKGNAAALREVWNRVDGKVRQDIGVDVDVTSEINRRLAEGRQRVARTQSAALP
jgi:hypothetical protein